MFPAVSARRTAHITLEDLSVIGGCGEARHARDLRNALAFPKERQAVLDPEEEDIFEDRHLHIFLKETAAFTLADVHMLRDLI